MRAYMESLFYVIYLVFIITIGIVLLIKSKDKKALFYFGLGAIILGFGDAFHLVPRSVGLFAKTLDNPSETLASWLGIGKLITSITMTIFYLLFYLFIYKRINKERNKVLDIFVSLLVLSRIVLCALPGNGWLVNSSNLLWGTIRNIPFVLLGVLVIVLSFIHLRNVKPYKLLYLMIILSFAFYLPVVFLASTYSWVGMMMLPKTICYMIIGFLGYKDLKQGE